MTRRISKISGVEVLYTTAEVRARIRAVMSAPGRRVAVVAFVGDHGEAYVKKAAGLEVYCWPQGASTSADMVHRVVRIDPSEEAYASGASCQAVQVYPRHACPPAPFTIDRNFRRVVRAMDWTDLGNEWPKASLLRRLVERYEALQEH